MAACNIKVTLDNQTDKERRDVVEAVIYNATDNACGEWAVSLEDSKDVWTLISANQAIGSSGALRIKTRGAKGNGFVAAFGYWAKNNTKWVGVTGDLPSGAKITATSVLPEFYGNGIYNTLEFWTQEDVFRKKDPLTGEEVTIALTCDDKNQVLNAVVTVKVL